MLDNILLFVEETIAQMQQDIKILSHAKSLLSINAFDYLKTDGQLVYATMILDDWEKLKNIILNEIELHLQNCDGVELVGNEDRQVILDCTPRPEGNDTEYDDFMVDPIIKDAIEDIQMREEFGEDYDYDEGDEE